MKSCEAFLRGLFGGPFVRFNCGEIIHRFKTFDATSALRADPVEGKIIKNGPGHDVILRVPLAGVVNKLAGRALKAFHAVYFMSS